MANTSNYKKKKFTFTKTSIVAFLILSLILTALIFVFKKPIENLINSKTRVDVVDYSGLVMHTIDVGQAEAIMIKLPDGKNMLVDSGERGSERNEKLKSYLDNSYFRDLENKEIDYFVLTHSDSDHIGGAVMIFNSFQVNKVFRPNIFSSRVDSESDIETTYNKKFVDTLIWGNVISAMYSEPNCEIEFSKAGINIVESNYSIKFYAPTENNYSDVNSYSPLIVIEYQQRKIMLTGDATVDTEEKALSGLPVCDVLNVAHHGSDTSSSEEFLEKVRPSYAVISANKNDSNNYNHPHQVVINRLLEYMTEDKIYRTDLNGNIILSVNPSGEIGVLLDVQNTSFYIRAEYILIAGICVLFVLCFSISYSKNKNKTKNN